MLQFFVYEILIVLPVDLSDVEQCKSAVKPNFDKE